MPRAAALLLVAVAGFGVEPPPLVLDHVTIVVPEGAPGAATAFTTAGFHMLGAEPNLPRLPGTGTRTLGFENAYLQLVWVTNRDSLNAADALLSRRLKWDDAGTSRFGFGLRRAGAGDALPFATTDHAGASYARTADHEPQVRVVPGDRAWTNVAPQLASELKHLNDTHRITLVTWVHRRGRNAEAIDWLQQREIVKGGLAGGEAFVEIELDDGHSGRRVDFRPRLPLVVRY